LTREQLRADLSASVARLVARAAAEHWPLRNDHCFLRVAYDNAVGGKWDVVHARPAWRSLSIDHLAAAVALAQSIEHDGVGRLRDLNANSLAWRRAARTDA
jgi:hypothetical protein